MASDKRRKRVIVALDFARPDGPRKLAGIMRFLAARKLRWDIRLKRGPGEFLLPDVRALPNWSVDGIIYSIPVRGNDTRRSVAALTALDIPLAVIDPGDEPAFNRIRRHIALVRTDSDSIGRIAAEHLASHPIYRSFGYISDTLMRRWSRERGKAFARAIGERGFETSVYEPPHRGRDDFGDLRTWLRGLPKPAAVLVAYDDRALTAYEACEAEGLRIPEDVALLSTGDDALLCDNFTPALSSIRPDHEREGYAAAALLSQMMRGGVIRHAHETSYPVKSVVVRGSSLPASSGTVLVHDALMLIRRRILEKDLAPAGIAAALRVSRTLLELRFREIRGNTVHAEIENMRLGMVRDKIKSTAWTIKEIAAACGFRDQSYLMRLFKRRYGTTIRSYRLS